MGAEAEALIAFVHAKIDRLDEPTRKTLTSLGIAIPEVNLQSHTRADLEAVVAHFQTQGW
jgi:hypothetical protein